MIAAYTIDDLWKMYAAGFGSGFILMGFIAINIVGRKR